MMKDEKMMDGKKKTQAEIEQEMAALQYTNPMLLEVRGPFYSSFNAFKLFQYEPQQEMLVLLGFI